MKIIANSTFFEQFEWYFWNFSPKIFRSALSSVRSFPTLIKVKAPTTSSSRRILKNVFLQKIHSGSWMHLQLPERPICQMSGLFPVIRFHQIWLQDCENPHPSKLANQESMTGRPKKALRPSQSIGQKSSGREKILRLGNGSSKENEQNEESSSADSGYKQVKVY